MKLTIYERLKHKASEALAFRYPVAPDRIDLIRGALSVTFDDFPTSAWHVAGPILADFGAKATYFVSGSCCEATFAGVKQYSTSDLLAVHAAGHEIGCHTYDHLAAFRCSPHDYTGSSDRNAVFLAKLGLSLTPTSFAYPYGQAPLPHRKLFAGRFAACRSTMHGINSAALDRSLLRAAGLEQWRKRKRDLLTSIGTLIRQAARDKAWFIVFTHDVSNHPSPYGCTPAELRAVLGLARREGLDILPMNNILLTPMA